MQDWQARGIVQDSDEESFAELEEDSPDELALDPPHGGATVKHFSPQQNDGPSQYEANINGDFNGPDRNATAAPTTLMGQEIKDEESPHTNLHASRAFEERDTETSHEPAVISSQEAVRARDTSATFDDRCRQLSVHANDIARDASLPRTMSSGSLTPALDDPTMALPPQMAPGSPVVLVNAPIDAGFTRRSVVSEATQDILRGEPGIVGRRGLRERNPIQMHPYLLENEAYRRSFRARGLRPVHFAQEIQQDTPALQESFQDLDEGSSQLEQSVRQSQSSPVIAALPSQGHSLASSGDDEDNLPKIETLLRKPQVGEVRRVHKRRKTSHLHGNAKTARNGAVTPAKSAASAAGARVASDDDVYDLNNALDTNPDHTQADVLFNRRRRRKRFRIPRALPEDSLPTPAASSELSPNAGKQTLVSSTSESDESSETHSAHDQDIPPVHCDLHPSPVLVDSSLSSSSSEAEVQQEVADPARRYQKKIRGVLPASWLRLDQPKKPQQPSSSHRPVHQQSSQKSPIKGVARRINTDSGPAKGTVETARALRERYDSSDEDESPDKTQATTSAGVERSLHDVGFGFRDQAMDVIEDNPIDTMPQAKARPSSPVRKKERKRQTRLVNFADNIQRNTRDFPRQESASPSHHNQSRKTHARHTGRHRKQWVRRKTIPKLSILDVPPSHSLPYEPDFVKLAKKRVRRRADLGRHSPFHKLLSLQTQQEGVDVDHVLSNWTAGRMQPDSVTAARTALTGPALRSTRHEKAAKALDGRTSKGDETRAQIGIQIPPERRTKGQRQTKHRHSQLNALPSVSLDANDNPLNFAVPPTPLQKRSGHSKLQEINPNKRQGQLEQTEAEHYGDNAEEAFHLHLQDTASYPQPRHDPPLIERFLASPENHNESSGHGTLREDYRTIDRTPIGRTRLRKRRPRQVHQDQIEVHQQHRHEHPPMSYPVDVDEDAPSPPQGLDLSGHLPYGSSYTTDFGIAPLPVGVCFRTNSFIGSGELATALAQQTEYVNESRGTTKVICEGVTYRFGEWSHETSVHLGKCLGIATQYSTDGGQHAHMPSRSASISILRSILQYLIHHLSFANPTGHLSFAASMLNALNVALNNLQDTVLAHKSLGKDRPGSRIIFLLFVIAQQTHNICQRFRDNTTDCIRLRKIRADLAAALASCIFSQPSPQILAFHDRTNIKLAQEFGVREIDEDVEAVVGLYHAFRSDDDHASFWAIVGNALKEQLCQQDSKIATFETIWHQLFAMLPLLEIDINGVLRPASRRQTFSQTQENNGFMKEILSKVFALVENATHHPTLNAYVRATLIRCFRLIRVWGWYRSEPILSSVYDFFAKRGFSLLATEQSNGSAIFLEELHAGDLPQIEDSDRSFHIFLKMLGAGLIAMRKVYPDKKIRNLAWRFVPNHGRACQADEGLRQSDLDSLRNQHDLLSVLYYASPKGNRPSLSTLRNLVNFRTSHAEICKVGVRAWSNLARFQVSTDEPLNSVEPFAHWFDEIVAGCVFQHRLAETEAESVSSDCRSFFSVDAVQATKAKNQREVENVLEGLLVSLQSILRRGSSPNLSRHVFETIDRTSMLRLLNSSLTSRTRCGLATVNAYEAYFDVVSRNKIATQIPSGNEDSQDYGDIDLDDIDHEMGNEPANSSQTETVANELFALLGDLLAPDAGADDVLIKACIDAHALAACHLVSQKRRDWLAYLDRQGSASWDRLPKHAETKSYWPYYLASLISKEKQIVAEQGTLIQSAWLESLVEQDSKLKYQHLLTSAMLNASDTEPLLHNLPFAKDETTELFNVCRDELRLRRISLLSSLISNIRQIWEDSWALASNRVAQQARDSCVTLLKSLMTAMKRNYLDIETGSAAHSTYVEFLQRIVEMLQQHVSSIPAVEIDKFFTDPSTFPLPAGDPHYVVGRLRSYEHGPGLRDESIQKKFVKFVEALVERAAIEEHMDALTEQIVSAVEGLKPVHDTARQGLWSMVIGTLAPAYLHVRREGNSCSWLLTSPVLQAAKHLLLGLLYKRNLGDYESAHSALPAVHALLKAALATLNLEKDGPEEKGSPVVLFNRSTYLCYEYRSVRDAIDLVTTIAPFLDLIICPDVNSEATHIAKDAWRYVDVVAHLELHCSTSLTYRALRGTQLPDSALGNDDRITRFAELEFSKASGNHWVSILSDAGGGGHVVQRKQGGRSLQFDLSFDEEEEGLRMDLRRLRNVVGAMGMLSDDERREMESRETTTREYTGEGDEWIEVERDEEENVSGGVLDELWV
ncbi:MAG: hypothetical protein Q9162_000942 [Coniocarpon cinnabarinum]